MSMTGLTSQQVYEAHEELKKLGFTKIRKENDWHKEECLAGRSLKPTIFLKCHYRHKLFIST